MSGNLDALPAKVPLKESEAFRKSQLEKWQASDTASIDPSQKNKNWAVKFPLKLLFLSACEGGDVDYARELLEMGVDINAKNCDGLAALHQATVNTDEDMMHFLIDNGADLDIFDNEGWTPLHAAASVGSLPFVELLIEKGANPVAVNHDGDTPYDLVKSDGDEGVREFLLQIIEDEGINLQEWKQAEENQMREDAAKWLKERNRASVNQAHPETGASPLHVAASKNFTDVMKLLLRAGADPDATDNDLWTPLHAAAHWSLSDAAKVLAEYGANFSLENKNGHTAKDLAESDMLAILQQLEEQQQDLIEARKCNAVDEIEDSLSRPINPTLPVRRSSVCRSSIVDKESSFKLKDKELEKIEIRKQASEPLPSIPATPATPPEDDLGFHIVSTGGKSASEGSSEAVKQEMVKDAEVAAGSSTREATTNKVEESTAAGDNDDTGSMISSIASSIREPEPSRKLPADDKENLSNADETKREETKSGAFDEIVKELEQSGRSESESSIRSATSSKSSVASSAEPESKSSAEKVKRRVDKIDVVPMKGSSVQFQMPFNRAVQSEEPVPRLQPKVTVSRKPKEVKTETQEAVITRPDFSKIDSTPDVIKQIDEKPKKPPFTDFNLLSQESVSSADSKSTSENEENRNKVDNQASNSGEPNIAAPGDSLITGGVKRTASWRVKKGASSKDKTENNDAGLTIAVKGNDGKSEEESANQNLPSVGDSQTTPPIRPAEDLESEQLTPKSPESSAILLPKNEEKEITRKQRARFERNTRRSTQGISAADLESALASPHHHPIREDKKEERERIESKFLTSSPALTSPTPQGMQSSQESSNSQSQQDQKQQSGPLEEATTPVRPFGGVTGSFFTRNSSYLENNNTVNKNDVASNSNREDVSNESRHSTLISTPSASSLFKSNSLRRFDRLRNHMGSSSDNSTISSVHMGSYPMDQTDHYATNSLDRVGYAHRSANKPPCPNCHQQVSQLEEEIRRLNSELSVFMSSSKWDEVQREKQERVQLIDRVSQLEVQLAEYETMSKSYTKVRNENASLIRLLANFVRTEYNIPSSRTPNRHPATTASATATSTATTESVTGTQKRNTDD